MRLFGLSPYGASADLWVEVGSVVLLALFLLWQFAYVLLAFRRIYADGWPAGAAKAALLVAVKWASAKPISMVAIWLAIQSLKRIG
jgi:hypothetical protein